MFPFVNMRRKQSKEELVEEMQGVSRRSFVTGVAALGAVTAAGLAGCAPKTPAQTQGAACKKHSTREGCYP